MPTKALVLAHRYGLPCEQGTNDLKETLVGYDYKFIKVSARGCQCDRFMLIVNDEKLEHVLIEIHSETGCRVEVCRNFDELKSQLGL